ncbi:hypothetical protein [Egicoccus sp. AB-alg2]|uniref:hypothetical protein n=1 Tax=Egicoccus sp. AB-alg2 TaxID=3242693 RepID=UPI00359F0813
MPTTGALEPMLPSRPGFRTARLLSLALLVVLLVGFPVAGHADNGNGRAAVQSSHDELTRAALRALADLGVDGQIDKLLADAPSNAQVRIKDNGNGRVEVRIEVDGKVRTRVEVRTDNGKGNAGKAAAKGAANGKANGNGKAKGNGKGNDQVGADSVKVSVKTKTQVTGPDGKKTTTQTRGNAVADAAKGTVKADARTNTSGPGGAQQRSSSETPLTRSRTPVGGDGTPPATEQPTRPSPSDRPSSPAPRPSETPAERAGTRVPPPALPPEDLAAGPDTTPPSPSPAPAAVSEAADAADAADTADGNDAESDQGTPVAAAGTPQSPDVLSGGIGERLSRAGEAGGALLNEARRAIETLPAPVRNFGVPIGLVLALASYLALQRRFRPGLLPMSVSGEPGQEGVRERHRL